MGYGFFNVNVLLTTDKASDSYEIYAGNNREYRGKWVTPKTGFTRFKINGKEENIYTADFLKFDESDEKARKLKTVQTVLWAVSLMLYLAAYLMKAPLGDDSLVDVCFFITLVFVLYLSYTMIVKISVHDVMTIYAFEVSSYRMCKAALVTGIVLTVDLGIMITCAAAQYDFSTASLGTANITALALQLGSAVLAFVMFFVENRRQAVKVPNKYVIPEGAEKIS